MQDDFYLRFEDRFRGGREDVTRKQRQYLPLLEPLQAVFSGGVTLDLGCGRGEWLELMLGMGFCARGVDLNESMVNLCTQRNLDAEKQDAIEALKELEDDSITILSGFHIVEHMIFDDMLTLVSEAFRVLRPGGLLILETPNPENLMVATWSFRMDPTHHHPIPPDLMQFVGHDAGFSPASIIRLNGPELPAGTAATFSDKMRHILSDAPDYGLVAQKPGDEGVAPVLAYIKKLDGQRAQIQTRLDELIESFQHEHNELVKGFQLERDELVKGFQLERDELVEGFQRERNERLEAFRIKSERLEHVSKHLIHKEQEVEETGRLLLEREAELSRVSEEKDTLRSDRDRLAAEQDRLQEQASRLQQEIEGVYASCSWRLTYPVRLLNRSRRNIAGSISRRLLRPLLGRAVRSPGVKWLGLVLLKPLPGVKQRLSHFLQADKRNSGVESLAPECAAEHGHALPSHVSERQEAMYRALLRAVREREKS